MWANITPVPNAVFDCYLKELKLAELKILLLVIRQTLGWENKKNTNERKQSDWISSSQLVSKTGSSPRSINSAIQFLVEKNLVEVVDEKNNLLDTPEKRKGKQKLFYRPSANFAVVDNKGKTTAKEEISIPANAYFAEDIRKSCVALTQKMRCTK